MPTLYPVIEEIYSAYEGHFLQDLEYVAHFMFLCVHGVSINFGCQWW
jgi:uncharacterized protein (UPF0276 family)